ncbi:MAG: flagellar protein G [Candidatus Methanoperedens sp.]|nr:flagellar protein G [Candidatus Methanoperedens sp.]MCZ7395963.1 flagellar protein G [Candidatus Methanoperedens sp.]
MAGESITTLIFFIATIIIAVGVIGVIKINVNSITASYSLSGSTQEDRIKTQITIINDPTNIPNSSWSDGLGRYYNYSFYVINTGKSALDPRSVNMFIDGNYVDTSGKWKVVNGGSTWYPTYVLSLNYTTSNTNPLPSGDHTLRVVAGNGVFDTIPFRK